MRCNKLNRLRWMPFLCSAIIFLTTIATVNSGPTNTRISRMIRDTTSSEISSTSNNITVNTCLQNGNLVPKSSVECEFKSGCRAIQKTGECCPQYQCECERNGKVYENGEKLFEPETPCRVCYCQGGEISCNPVTCYNRNDCEPKFIVGRCCPEYDNCPPLDQVKHLISSTSTTESSVIATNDVNHPTASNDDKRSNPLGISIKEITKPGEIRFTNEKPKANGNNIKTTQNGTSTTKEPNNQISNADENLVENVSQLTPPSSTLESRDTETNRGGPSVFHIGDKALILDKNRPSTSITVVGVEGLQLGGEEVDDYHHEKNYATVNVTSANLTAADEFTGYDDFNSTFNNDLELNDSNWNFIEALEKESNFTESSSLVYDELNSTALFEGGIYNASNFYDEDHVASSSDTIQVLTSINNDTLYDFGNDSLLTDESFVYSSTTEKPPQSSMSTMLEETASSSRKTYVEDDEIPNHELINPGHAPIPEDLSNFGRDQDLASVDPENDGDKMSHTKKSEHKILNSVMSMRANATIERERNKASTTFMVPPMSQDWLKQTGDDTITDPSISSGGGPMNLGTENSDSREESGSGGFDTSSYLDASKPTVSFDDSSESSSPLDGSTSSEDFLLFSSSSTTETTKH